ncbi:MAG: MFS transporter [Actinomycetia bacterium]|nr:MFS transporter [Actinomycetes bacterium]
MSQAPTHEDDHFPIEPPTDSATREADTVGAPQGMLRRFRTFESFRHRDFRLFFSGALVSSVGTWMQTTALGWLVYDLTKHSGSIGLVNFLAGVPIFVLIIFTGALADRTDRQRLLIVTQVVLMLQAVAFALLAARGNISMAWIYGLSLAGGVASAFMSPAWQAMTPDLVPRELLMNAIALSSAQFNAARLIGPVAAAMVVALFSHSKSSGVTEVFWVNAASYLFVIWALAVIHPHQHIVPKRSGVSPWGALAAGLTYAREHRRVRMHLLTAMMITIFGMPFATLLPAIATKLLHLGVSGYSGLMAANGLGALVGALGVASISANVRREAVIRTALIVMPLAATVLALSKTTALSMGALVVMGAAFLTTVSSVNTNLQTAVPPEIRARVMSLFVLSFMGMMPFGALLFGWLGDLIGAEGAILAGASVLLAYAVFLTAKPALLCDQITGC